MRQDNRLSRVLHVLMHLDEAEEPITSEMIGQMLGTNSSLVRRTMGGLRQAGLVGSTKGHGGGWYLERSLKEVTLADVYEALGEPSLFAMGVPTDEASCLLERAANAATDTALSRAREEFMTCLRQQTVADVIDGVRGEIEQWRREREETGAGPVHG